jgi:uncharacterized membrane protein YbaN (DUF454 family)
MTGSVKRFLGIVAGWLFLVLGVIGLFLPLLQGILFIAIGLTILSAEYAWARKLLAALSARFPKFSRVAKDASDKATAWLKRSFKANGAV